MTDCLKMYKISYEVIKIHQGNHKKKQLESGIDSRRRWFIFGESLENDLLWRCAFIITIYDSDDVTESHT